MVRKNEEVEVTEAAVKAASSMSSQRGGAQVMQSERQAAGAQPPTPAPRQRRTSLERQTLRENLQQRDVVSSMAATGRTRSAVKPQTVTTSAAKCEQAPASASYRPGKETGAPKPSGAAPRPAQQGKETARAPELQMAEEIPTLVNHVDKTPPKILNKEKPSTVETMKDGRSCIPITSRNLRASDSGSTDEEILFVILRSPRFGHLENAKTGNHIGRTFTQRDINQRTIRYVINPEYVVNSDSFEFEISDQSGNKISPETLDLCWSVLELAESYYRICENAGTLVVTVKRRGSSKDPAFVGIKVQEISARLGQDFTHTGASLVQFDPGVSTKSWNIYVKNDGLEENHEFLKIILRSPKNGVLGKVTEATIEITDPRQGQCRGQDSPAGEIFYHAIIGSSRGHRLRSDTRGEDGQSASPQITQILLPNARRSHAPHPGIEVASPGPQRRRTASGVLYPEKTPRSSRRGAVWLVGAPPILPLDASERPLQDSAVVEHKTQNTTKQNKKPKICPAGWSQHQKFCYYLSTNHKTTWEDAEHHCQQREGGHITAVESGADMRWLWKFADKKPFWIGLRLQGEPSRWRWTNQQPWTFSNFKKTKSPVPGSAEDCVLVGRRREWLLSGCGRRHRYICSFPL